MPEYMSSSIFIQRGIMKEGYAADLWQQCGMRMTYWLDLLDSHRVPCHNILPQIEGNLSDILCIISGLAQKYPKPD